MRKLTVVVLAVTVAVVAAACGKSADEAAAPVTDTAGGATATETTAPPAPTNQREVTSPAAVGDFTEPIVWGVYRETNSLDPIFAFDYPENTVLFTMCEAVLRQQPDGSIAPGLGDVASPDPTTFVITLKEGITFWDGTPLTADDVVFSLERARNPELGGFYGQVFTRVESITATGPLEVTVKLTQPDFWFRGELSGPPGVVVNKAFVEAAGDKFGTVDGGTMCTGPFKLDSWQTGEGVTVAKNDTYWDTTLTPKLSKVTFKGFPDDAALTSAFLTGELDGYYPLQLTTLDQLKAAPEVKVHQGPAGVSDALVVSSLEGTLGDVRVRRALSLAIDRQGIIDQVYKGSAQIPHALSNPGTWGYAPEVFAAAWDALPAMDQDLEAAKALIAEAGAEGKTITLGTSSEIPALNTEAQSVQSAANSIGLKAELESVSAANYINFFIDPEARKTVDGFFTGNYGDYADPAALLSTIVLKEGSQNFSGYENAEILAAMEAARAEPDDAARAAHVVEAQRLITEDLVWIPVTVPDTVLIMNAKITGAPVSFQYMFGPWLASVGASG